VTVTAISNAFACCEAVIVDGAPSDGSTETELGLNWHTNGLAVLIELGRGEG
jgi:hypothetical protein